MITHKLFFKVLIYLALLAPCSVYATLPSAPYLDVALNGETVSICWSNVDDAINNLIQGIGITGKCHININIKSLKRRQIWILLSI